MGEVIFKNRVKHWRHRLAIDSQKEFADLLGFSKYNVNRWEQQREQPTLQTLIKIYTRLKEHIPELHMEDLLEIEAPE